MGKTELILGLARCSFLTCSEKEILAKNLDNLQSLTVLSIEAISAIIGRFVRTRIWNPSLLTELVDRDQEIMRKFGIEWVPILSSIFPPLLREIHDAPFVLFWRGHLPDPERPLVAIVGTRSPSGDGALAAQRLGREFGEMHISVVSGLARGIDAFAHRGNIDGGGSSVAVLACGVDQIYPRSNVCLAARLVDSGGCILSEYSPGEMPLQYRFPQRNRIISGLARSVIVVEAPEKSGALITADFALEQGRDLYIYEGTLDSSRGLGSRKLFEQGAPSLYGSETILESWSYPMKENRSNGISVSTQGESFSSSVGKQMAFDFRKELSQ